VKIIGNLKLAFIIVSQVSFWFGFALGLLL